MTFFSGAILTKLLDLLIHKITGYSDDDDIDVLFAEMEKNEQMEKGVELASEPGNQVVAVTVQMDKEDSLSVSRSSDDDLSDDDDLQKTQHGEINSQASVDTTK